MIHYSNTLFKIFFNHAKSLFFSVLDYTLTCAESLDVIFAKILIVSFTVAISFVDVNNDATRQVTWYVT